jgi:limonene-1,2-epoxide hydrolase
VTAAEIVDAFIAACEKKDTEAALALVSDDVAYENVGMSTTTGPDAMRDFLGPFFAGVDEVEWVVHRQVSTADVVMNERTDRFRVGDTWAEIRLMGVFVVRDGLISEWRDYFDVSTAGSELAKLQS